ncbi:MAG TPA: hypothetical protein VHO25_22995, partial [Polyangiaceae bacterium]|nr:hypothetical protein [Polyangiaceae bacterium]
ARVEQYEVVVTTLVRLLVTGVVWGPPELLPTWSGALERVATCQQDGGTILWLRLRRYPGLLLMYAAGLAAVVTGNYRALQSILLGTKARIEGDEKVPLVQELYPQAALDRDWANTSLFNSERKYVPVSERIFAYLRDQFRPWLPDDDDYQLAFDRFEFMLAMTYSAHGGGTFAPAGRFIHTWRYRDQRPRIAFEISDEIAAQGDMWLPILARLFPNKESALEAIKAVRELVGRWG